MLSKFRSVIHSGSLICLSLMTSSCGGGGSSSGGVGTCDIQADPAVTILTAKDATTGAALPTISITSVKLDGKATDLTLVALAGKNLSVSGGSLICTIACGFGSSEGRYDVTIESQGYEPKEISVNATYAIKSYGCPGRLSDGAKVDITMARK